MESKRTDSEKDWKQTVYSWLAEEGMFRKEVDDPKATFHFSANYPVGSPYQVELIKPRDMKDGLLVVAILRVAPQHRQKLTKMSPEKRKDLIFGLKMRLLQQRPGFSVKERDGAWDAAQFQVRLLYDTLSKTRLIEAIDDVFRCMLVVIWTFANAFGLPTNAQQPGFYA
ncbi:MAG: DUF2299 domain-containing protein [Promethearchaeota archaeon]